MNNGNVGINQHKQVRAQGGIRIATDEEARQGKPAQRGQPNGSLLLDLTLQAAKKNGSAVRHVHCRLDLGYRNDRQLHRNRGESS